MPGRQFIEFFQQPLAATAEQFGFSATTKQFSLASTIEQFGIPAAAIEQRKSSAAVVEQLSIEQFESISGRSELRTSMDRSTRGRKQ